MIKAVVGLNWGDEGKGRMVDYFASKADCVIRYQGGNNAGHTVKNDLGKFVFHSCPSGVCYKNVLNIIAAGSVINPESFIHELQSLKTKGIEEPNIVISDRAILTMPYHLYIERLEEERLKKKAYGSTLSGIAPTYGDKYLKKGIQTGELFYPDTLKEHLKDVVEYENKIIQRVYGSKPLNFESIYEWLIQYGEL